MISNNTERAQTTFDFLLGFSIFIFAITFVFMSVPGFLTPFTEGSGANPLVADRVADHLSESKFIDEQSGKWDTESANEFFQKEETSEIRNELEIHNTTSIHISVMKVDSDEVATDSGIDYIVGESLPKDSTQISLSERLVSKDGTLYRLHVRVW